MRLILNGKINSLYVQSLCMMFFRGEKFPLREENPRGEIKVDSIDTPTGIVCYAKVLYDGKEGLGEYTASFEECGSYARTSKIATGYAVFQACTMITGYKPVWGLLTGIRPSTVAQELIYRYGEVQASEILQSRYLLSPKKAELAVNVSSHECDILKKYDDKSCSIYVSIPFCPTRCNYCSFISYATKKLFELIPQYVERLVLEIRKTFDLIKKLGLKVKTIYIGGGTPTMLSASQLERILCEIDIGCKNEEIDEFTVESGRPDTISEEKLKVLKKYGVTRVSVNPQTLNDNVLLNIGRRHTVKDFFDAYDLVKEHNFEIVNTDLIAGLDGDDFESFKRTVDQIIDLSPENITLHTFSVKKASQVLSDNQDVYNINGDWVIKGLEYAYDSLIMAGYIPYYMYRQKNTMSDLENVGYAKLGSFGIYNVLMMGDGHSIFGVGAGSTTKLIRGTGDKRQILRIFSPKYPYEYLQDNQNIEAKAIDFLEGGSNENN